MIRHLAAWVLGTLLLLAGCDSLPGALDEGGGSGGSLPPTPPAFLRIENHGPTLVVDSVVAETCPTVPAPDARRWNLSLPAPGTATIAVPAWTCYDYILYATAPTIGFTGAYDYSTFGPAPGDTVVTHVYDPT